MKIRQIFFQCLSVVKRTQVKFKNVAADQCLEHIINWYLKSICEISCSMRKKDLITYLEIPYHR